MKNFIAIKECLESKYRLTTKTVATSSSILLQHKTKFSTSIWELANVKNMIINEEFKQECDAWLKPLGYSINATTNNSIIYTHYPDDTFPWPHIECWQESTNSYGKRCRLLAGGRLGLINASIGPISLNHQSIKRFIAYLRYFSNCVQNSHSNPIAQHHIQNLQNDYWYEQVKD